MASVKAAAVKNERGMMEPACGISVGRLGQQTSKRQTQGGTNVVTWLNPRATGGLRAACMEPLMWSLSIAVKRDAELTTRDPASEKTTYCASGHRPVRNGSSSASRRKS